MQAGCGRGRGQTYERTETLLYCRHDGQPAGKLRGDGQFPRRQDDSLKVGDPLLNEVEKVFADGSFKGTVSQEMPESAALRWKYPPFLSLGKVRWTSTKNVGWLSRQ